MSGWQGLAELCRALSLLPRPKTGEVRADAALVAAAHFGEAFTLSHPAAVNVGALALSMPRVVAHELRPDAIELIGGTDLHSLPDAPPTLLRGACIIESHDPAQPMFGQTSSLGCYSLDGVRYLVGLDYPDGIIVCRWRPKWVGGDLDATVVPEQNTALIEGIDAEEHAEWGRQAARLLVVLGLLLDARSTPLRVRDEGPVLAGVRHGKRRPARPWSVRYVQLQTVARTVERGEGTAERDGLQAETVPVRGHLKRVRTGPGRSEVSWVFVEGYEARRWVSPKPTRIVVRR